MLYDFYVGSYAPADHESIYRYQLNGETGALVRKCAIKGVDNPSWLLLHPNGKLMYSVEELNPDGRVAVYSLENDVPEYLFSLETEGADPCHLSLSPDGSFLFAANYSSGSLSVFRLDSSGRPEGMSDCRQHTGKGCHPKRQEGPHVHFTRMIDGLLCVCDLGLDCIAAYSLDEAAGRLTERGKVFCFPGGYGPRHLAVHDAHKGFVYVIGELTGDLCVLHRNGSQYELLQRISSLPEYFAGEEATEENTAAAIRFSENGRLLFVSNRGADSVTSFFVRADGKAEKVDSVSSGGNGPRDFAVFGKYIVVANQHSDNLSVLEFEPESGKMKRLAGSEPLTKPAVITRIRPVLPVPAASGHAPAASGHSGHAPATSDHAPATSGHAPAASGHAPAASSHAPAVSGHSGHVPAASSHAPGEEGDWRLSSEESGD